MIKNILQILLQLRSTKEQATLLSGSNPSKAIISFTESSQFIDLTKKHLHIIQVLSKTKTIDIITKSNSSIPVAVCIFLNYQLIIIEYNCRSCERSEEHTSELQSRENLVCRLLLEKK